jgi:NAD(P)-dependent dehydrogenase (short-subunit alcohol dehydrogenase family)
MSEQSRSAIALVTGANRGIGKEVARQLAEHGYQVLLSARDEEKARAAARELADSPGGAVRALTLDVSDPDSIEAAAERVQADPGQLDVLVNNAGVGGGQLIHKTDTRALALELVKRGITVNAICPGWVDTAMAAQGMQAGANAMGLTFDEFRAQALGDVPIKRIIQPEEIANLVKFLASPQASAITGQTYNICGGQIMN